MAKRSIYKSEEGQKQILSFYEKLLLSWPQPSKQLILETTPGKTFVIESGDKQAPPLLLLHGSGTNSAMWKADVRELSQKYHVFVIDIIGECGKSTQRRLPFETGNYARWLMEVITQLNIAKPSVIACSLGGWIALDLATTYPDKVDKLVLLATAGIAPVKISTVFWIIITSLTGKWGFKQLNRMVYGPLKIDQKALDFASLLMEYYNPRTNDLPVFKNEQLAKINSPVLFIGGENDCFYPSKKTAARLKASVINCQCKVLQNTGHVVLNQSKTIAEFLNHD